MSIIEITRPTTDQPTGPTLRVTVLGVVSPFAEGDALRELIEGFGAQADEFAPRGDVARRFDVRCADERQRAEIVERLAAGDEYGHVLVEETTFDERADGPTTHADDLSWSHLPGTLRTQLHETARYH